MIKKLFIAIVTLSILLRFVNLSSLPAGLSWDEAAIGYNGYGIATVHRDEWLNKMPVTFKSFGDYKAATAIYLNALSTKVFGLNTFGIRFPMALSGVITVIASYFIALYILKDKKASLVVMLLVAVSPLNVHYSRIAFESGIAVAVMSLAMLSYLYAPKKPIIMYPISSALFVLSMYTYHSTKIAVPLIVCILMVHFFKEKRKHVLPVILAGVIGFALLFPLAKETLTGKAGERFYMTSALLQDGKLKSAPQIVQVVVQNTLLHMDPQFLLFGKATTYRHGNYVFGIMGYIEFFLFIVGVGSLFLKKKNHQYIWILFILCASLLPAVISNDAPHSNRAHGIVPWIQILSGFGLLYLTEKFTQYRKYIYTGVVIGTLVITGWYTKEYVHIYTYDATSDFQYGYAQAISIARKEESRVDHILFTSAYGQPYIYILMAKRLTPIQWQQGALSNYELRDINWEQDKTKEHTLIVGTDKEIPSDAEHIIHEVKDPSGHVVFRIVENL